MYLLTNILSWILFVKMLFYYAILNYKTSIERCVSVVRLFSCQVVSFLPCYTFNKISKMQNHNINY